MTTELHNTQNGQQEISQERSLNLRDYYFIFRTYYKLIVAMTILGLCIGFYSVLTLPPKYTATSSVAIREKPGASMIMDLTGNQDRNRMSNEIQLIKSRSVAKGTIESIWDQKKNNLALFDSYPFTLEEKGSSSIKGIIFQWDYMIQNQMDLLNILKIIMMKLVNVLQIGFWLV